MNFGSGERRSKRVIIFEFLSRIANASAIISFRIRSRITRRFSQSGRSKRMARVLRPSFERTREPCCLIPLVKAIRVCVRSLDSLVARNPDHFFGRMRNSDPAFCSACRQIRRNVRDCGQLLLAKQIPSKTYSSVPPYLAAPRYRNNSTENAGTASKTKTLPFNGHVLVTRH